MHTGESRRTRRGKLRTPHTVLALIVAFSLAGCANYIGERIVRAPNHDQPYGLFSQQLEASWESKVAAHFFTEQTRIVSPVDGIELHAALLPAGHYPHRLTINHSGDGIAVEFNAAMPVGPPSAPARGTIVAIHGWQTEHRALLSHAMELAGEGWDVVLYDQRGHGRSTGEMVTFGVRERHDLRAVVDWTRSRDYYTPPLVLFGTSMGASTALLAAVESRPDAVIAVAPYARIRSTLRRALRRLAPSYVRLFLTRKRIDRALAHAQEISGVSLADAAPLDLAADIEAPVLLIYSEADAFVPPEHARQLYGALPDVTLERIEDRSHETLLIDRDAILDVAVPWLENLPQLNR